MRIACRLLFVMFLLLPISKLLTHAQNSNTGQGLLGSTGGSREPAELLAQKLNLTMDQKEKLGVILERARREADATNKDTSLTDDVKRDRLKHINYSKREQINSILTSEQQQKFTQLIQQSQLRQFPERNHIRKNEEINATDANHSIGGSAPPPGALASGRSFSATPLVDFSPGQKYLGQLEGFLYEGSNVPPATHDAKGKEVAKQIEPLDNNGDPSSRGKIVFLSIGFSNPNLKWCGAALSPPSKCLQESFTKQALASPKTNKSSVVILNGAIGGQPTRAWADPNGRDYILVRDRVLTPAGVTEKQVQAIWMEIVEPNPIVSLPAKDADAYTLEVLAGHACRALKTRYSNLKQLFISPRSYGGYANRGSPEPFAYETGFTVKWLIQAQINQMSTGHVDERAGDLSYKTGVAPWTTWGPYFWASGTKHRLDGVFYERADYRDSDGLHPSFQGIRKIASFMLNWFLSSSYTPWFRMA